MQFALLGPSGKGGWTVTPAPDRRGWTRASAAKDAFAEFDVNGAGPNTGPPQSQEGYLGEQLLALSRKLTRDELKIVFC